MNPIDAGIQEIREAISSRQASATEIVDAFLGRIDQYDGGVNAFREVHADRARQRAGMVDAGSIDGPLAGVPVAIKDNFCTTFGTTACASRMLADYRSPYDATVVARLEHAGAIVLGKTNMDEFAMGSSTEASAFGPTRNPWDARHVPGGSSGGSAAAVSAGMCTVALGSDTGGSIRQPAAHCGVVGMKPTYGRVSRYGLVAFASSLDQIGPFGHRVADVATLLEVISGPDPRDSTCADIASEPYASDLDRPIDALRIGLAAQYLSDANDPAVAAAVDEAVALFRDRGAEIVEVDLPHTEYGIPTYYIVCTAEASSNLARYDGIHYGHRAESGDGQDLVDLCCRSRAEGFGDEVKRRIMLGTYTLSSGYYDAFYLRALKVRRLIKEDFDRAFEQCDAILCPTTTGPGFRIGELTDNPLEMYLNDVYTVNANLAGIPGIVLPAGTAKSATSGADLPIAVQLLGPIFGERKLLRIAATYEAGASRPSMRPSLAAG